MLHTNQQIIKQLNLSLFPNNEVIIDFINSCINAYAKKWHKKVADEIAKIFPPQTYNKTDSLERLNNIICDMPLDQAAYWLSTIYSYISKTKRLKLGMYFTPPDLATFVISKIKKISPNFKSSIIFDPASGGGAFLVPTARSLKVDLKTTGALPIDILNHIATHLKGIDIDDGLNSLTKAFLIMELEDEIFSCGNTPTFNILTGDSLETNICGNHFDCDIIICNPPYRRLKITEYSNLRQKEPNLVKLYQNLYARFIVKSIQHLRNGGKASLIIPGSFFCGRKYQHLRDYIMDNARVHYLYTINQREGLFFNVQQDTVVLCIEKSSNGTLDGEECKSSHLHSMNHRYKTKSILNRGEPWSVAKSDLQLKSMCSDQYRISDYGYEIYSGSVVWNRDKRTVLLKPTNNMTNVYPLLWSTCVAPGGVLDHSRAPCINHGPGKKKGPFIKLKNGEKAGLFHTAGVLIKRTTSTSQSRRLHCAPIPEYFVQKYGGYLGENHVYILAPKKNASPVVSVETLAAVLNTKVVDQAYRRFSLTASVSKYELLRLPLPVPSLLLMNLAKGMEMEMAVFHSYEVE